MQHERAENEIAERALGRHARELFAIRRVDLLPQTGQQHELRDIGAEAGQERVERVVAEHHAENELRDTGGHQENHEGINKPDPGGRLLVALPHLGHNFRNRHVCGGEVSTLTATTGDPYAYMLCIYL